MLNFESKSKNRFSAYVIHNSGFGLFAPVEAISGLKIDQFGLCFESLGFNCELGFIQRSCGAEPLSLTRFSGISIAEMTRGLQEGFCRLAFPENLTAERPGSEWDIRDRTYNLAYHTFLNIDEISEEDLILQQAKRLKFVLRKYLEDISDAEKIFVIWRNAKPLDAQEVACLRAAIRIHGDPTVLWISQAGDEPFGLVERLEPKLLRGYVEGYTPQGNGAWLHYWLPVLLNAFKLDQAEKR